MKATLSFTLPEEHDEFEAAVKASDYKLALWEIAQEIFRPARKHGYQDGRIQQVLDKADEVNVLADASGTEYEIGAGSELVSMLEQKFYEVLRKRNIEL
jgi:hypothetical protein